jgi:hypothetical protein
MAAEFPRTTVGGVSLPRLIIGSNWFLGYSHTSKAQDDFIKSYQTRKNIADICAVFMEAGVDAIMGMGDQVMMDAAHDAEQRTGRKMTFVLTPSWDTKAAITDQGVIAKAVDVCLQKGGTFVLPHQNVTDALTDKRAGIIRDLDIITKLIREREMIPGLSTHMPEVPVFADRQGADVETYIQIYNGEGFLMQIEIDWVQRMIRDAKKPVMTIKPLAAGRLMPIVGLAFVWSTLREQDMVTIGCTTPDEAKECIELSLDMLERRMPDNELQYTRSKAALRR